MEPSRFPVPNEPGIEAAHNAAPGIRILVADDDPNLRELICTWLKQWDYDVVTAGNGTEAMNVLQMANAPTLAILDWMMPGLDGIEICRAIRAAGRQLYIIIATARGSRENIAEGLSAGADDYLVKPVEKDELHVRILVGLRVIALQAALDDRLRKLDVASAELSDLKLQYAL